MPASIADLATFFDASPNPYLVLDRDLNIATANKAYLASVRRELPDIVGRWAWDAFPTDEETLRQAVDSFQRVLRTRQADTMALLRFDVPRPASEGGGLEKRYWSITHTPVLGDDDEVSFVLQHPIDVTDLETLRQTIEAGDSGVQLRPDHSGIFERAEAVYRANQALTAEAERNAAAITALTDEREKLIGLFEQAPAMIALLLGSEHRFAFANASYRASVGQRELIGRTVVEALSDAAEQGYVALLDHAFATGEPYQARGARYDVQAEPDGPIDQRLLDFIYQPVRDDAGAVIGILVQGVDVTETMRAADELAATEDRYRSVLDAIDVGFCIIRMRFNDAGEPVDYMIEEGNTAYERQTGLHGSFGKWVSELAPDLEKHWFELYGRVAATGGPVRFENFAEPLGHWYDVHALRIGRPDEHRVALLFNDITERKNAEVALQQTNETLEREVVERTVERDRMWETSPDLMLVIDFDGVFRRVNPAWTDLLGYEPHELVGHHVNEFVLPDDHAGTIGAYETAATGQHATVENRYRHKDGSTRWISWVAAPAGELTYATGRDITQQREVEARLRDEQDFARLALSAVGGVGVWTYDIRSDRFFCDAAISALYALDPARGAAGLSSAEFLANVHPQDRVELNGVMAAGLQRAGEIELEYRIVHPDGSLHWVLSRGHTYFDAEGHPSRRTGVGVDMTSQRLIEDQLRQAQKMEAVGQLTGGLAHDFNNLLTGMMGNMELLQIRLAQGKIQDSERFIVAAQGAGRRAASLTQRLLAFSRRQTLDPKPTDVNRLTAGMEELFRRTVGPEIEIEIVGAAGLWTANIDAGQLENALLNLCINARDAMPDGGRITIETANKWLDERTARERDLPPGQYLSVCVTDTGTGMTAETIQRAFEPFFTTKPLGEGTGLGLSMIYGFARQSDGQVRIYSELGMGTTICIYLPRFVGDAMLVEEEEALTIAAQATGQTILVVDDEATIRHLIDEVLDEAGYTVIGAADGNAGLKVLQSGARIELLITDVGLPGGMNGRQVADAARALRPGLKVLFITGYAENAAVGNGHLEAGMELLTKPFTLEALSAKVGSMIKRD
ncbi:PAS domain-containing protein [Sphingomonas lacusdianchii]|uniref:PAS domain-containing protein n=1 Tax=Sphingomonas lacusdianchii TaxID=2917992 RepID=UPI001F59436A